MSIKPHIIPILQTKLETINQIICSIDEACSLLQIETSYNHLIRTSQRDPDFNSILANDLNWLLEILSLRNEQANRLTLDAIQTIVYNQLLPQVSYLLILRIFNEILLQSKEHSSLILELLMKMIKPEAIQISTQNIQRLFLLGVLLYSHMKNKSSSVDYLNQLTGTLFKFLNTLLNPVIEKQNKRMLPAYIELDDVKHNPRNSSFFTITESQSEIEQIQQQEKEEVNDKAIEMDINEYIECDIYISSNWVFQYLLNVLNAKSNNNAISKSDAIDIILNIVFTSNKHLCLLSEFIKGIRNDLGTSLSNILRLHNCEFDLRFKAIKLSYYLINTYHYCYYLIPLCLSKHGCYNSIEKYLCYELISKFLKDPVLLSDLYTLRNENENEIKYDDDDILGKSIMSLLTKESLSAITSMPIKVSSRHISLFDDNTITNDIGIYRGHYISVISEILKALEYSHVTSLNSQKISLDEFVSLPFDSSSEQYHYIRTKLIFYSLYMKNMLSLLVKEEVKGMMNKHIDTIVIFIKIYSIFHIDKSKEDLFELLIEAMSHKLISNDSLIYCGKQVFALAEQKQFNQDIESWVCLIKAMQHLFIKVHDSANNNLFIPLPSIDLEAYIKFIEHHLRIFTFDYYDSIFKHNIDDAIQEEYSNCIGTMTDVSIIETKDSNYASSPIFSCIKVRKVSTFRKKSSTMMLDEASFTNTNGNLNTISDLIETFYFSNTASYDDNYLLSVIFSAFGKSLANIVERFTKSADDIMKLKFVLMKMGDMLACNLSRVNLCWEKFIAILYDIYKLDYCELSVMAFDVLIIIAMLIFHSYNDGYMMLNEWSSEVYQCTIFASIKKFILPILNTKTEILNFIIDDMYTLANTFGKNMTRPAWGKFIQIVLMILKAVEDTYIAYSLCETVFNYFNVLLMFQFNSLLIEIIQILLAKSNSKVKEACINQLIIISKEENHLNNNKAFYSDLFSVLYESLLDDEYIIRKKTIELLKCFNKDQYSSSLTNEDENILNYARYYEFMERIYERYKEHHKRNRRKLSNSSNSNTLEQSRLKEAQEEIEWEDTVINGLTIISTNDLIKSYSFFYMLVDKVLMLSSPKILEQIFRLLNNIEISIDNDQEDKGDHITYAITNLVNYISSEYFIQNFDITDSPLISNLVTLLITITNNNKTNKILWHELLVKTLKTATGFKSATMTPNTFSTSSNELNYNETIVFDFVRSIDHLYTKDVIQLYISNIVSLDSNNPLINEHICKKAMNDLLILYSNKKAVQCLNDNIDHLCQSFNSLIKKCYNKPFQQHFKHINSTDTNHKQIWSIAFISYTKIVSIIIRADTNNSIHQLKLFDRMLLLSEYILRQTDDILLLELIGYLTTELIHVTNEQFYTCRSRFTALFTGYLFKLKNTNAMNAMMTLLFKQTNRLSDEIIGKLIKEKIKGFVDDEKKNEISMPKVRVNEIELVLKHIREYVTKNITNDEKKPMIYFINRELESMRKSNEILLVNITKEICNYINV